MGKVGRDDEEDWVIVDWVVADWVVVDPVAAAVLLLLMINPRLINAPSTNPGGFPVDVDFPRSLSTSAKFELAAIISSVKWSFPLPICQV